MSDNRHEGFSRRSFLKTGASFGAAAMLGRIAEVQGEDVDRPNVLWLVSEDNSPWLGCYGVEGARTPNLDKLAAEGVRFDNACANGAVCAPCRHTIITGKYATSNCGQHMRSFTRFGPGVCLFPAYLRQAGYYTTNNSKTDYNGGLHKPSVPEELHRGWDESSNKAHWRKRPRGKPFFSVFNFGITHESQLMPRKWGDRELETDPAVVDLPPYLPDDPIVREDLARYYDLHAQLDEQIAAKIQDLKDDGLYEDTIIFYYGDHGGSMPRGKSFIYESGTRVPMIVHVPDKFQHLCPWNPGSSTDEPVAFVDLAPTMLSLAGLPVPDYMEGQAFLGEGRVAPPERRRYQFSFRGRRGDSYDICRAARDRRYKYIRNYTPHVPVMQYNGYSWQIRSYNVWHEHYEQGKLDPHQARWFQAPKPPEELYDLQQDPHELDNLAGDPQHAAKLQELSNALDEHLLSTRDSGFHPEGMGPKSNQALAGPEQYPLRDLMHAARLASRIDPENLPLLVEAMDDRDPGMRWWAAMGCVYLREQARPATEDLMALLADASDHVRTAAAEALCYCGRSQEMVPVFGELIGQGGEWVQLQAILALRQVCGQMDESVVDMGQVKQIVLAAAENGNSYVKRVAAHMIESHGWAGE